MGDRNVTLFALHLRNDGDVQIGPERISTGGQEEPSKPSRWSKRREALPIPLAAGAVALLAVAALAWRVVSGR